MDKSEVEDNAKRLAVLPERIAVSLADSRPPVPLDIAFERLEAKYQLTNKQTG